MRILSSRVGLVVLGTFFVSAQANRPFSQVRWIVENSALGGLRDLDLADAKTYLNNPLTNIQGHAGLRLPRGWSGVPDLHYSAFGSCTSSTDVRRCTSLNDDLQAGAINSAAIPLVMYDDERWGKTPSAEQKDPCNYMQQFTQLAHAHGFATIMAPDQNLASPLVGIAYQGGETENWQSYLRLGLATCAARTGSERFHVMAQPFEGHWGPTPEGTYAGSEADFVNYVTQASLQAKAVNPKIVITAGLSTNPRYNPTAQTMYQESVDVLNIVDGFWLNLWGNPMGVAYLKLLSGQPPAPNSSVVFLRSGHTLANTMPSGRTAAKFSLATAGATLTSWTDQTYPSGAIIPAGAWEFQFWTDGSSGSAQLALEFGYCKPSDCTDRTPIAGQGSAWNPSVTTGALGAADAHGALETKSATSLRPGGPYSLYWTLKVVNAGPFNLLYDSPQSPTNLATPFLHARPD